VNASCTATPTTNPATWLGSRAVVTEAEAATYPTDHGLCAPRYVENLLADAFGVELPDEEDVEVPEGVRHFILTR
jgi:hypothetical protein